MDDWWSIIAGIVIVMEATKNNHVLNLYMLLVCLAGIYVCVDVLLTLFNIATTFFDGDVIEYPSLIGSIGDYLVQGL